MSGQSPPKRPRLSLQIKALSTGPSIRTSRTLAAVVNPRSPTSFNTLSNVYSTAIDRSSSTPVPVTAEPITAINMNTKGLPNLPRLQMPNNLAMDRSTHTPYVTTQFPETPLTARPMSPAVAMDITFPSTMTATPPLSAGPIDPGTIQTQVFCFSPDDIQRNSYLRGNGNLNILVSSEDSLSAEEDQDTAIGDSCSESSFTASETGVDTPFPADLQPSPLQLKPATTTTHRRITAPAIILPGRPAPYVHPRALHSILRNSPLPPFTALSPMSPRRQSQRLLEKASRHVMYHSPLTQTITTNLYTKSHIDLLCEEASPFSSPSTTTPAGNDADMVLDLTLAYSGDETRDGGATPGPFEEMRRRLAGLGTSSTSTSAATTPVSPGCSLSSHSSGGIRKRKQPRKDKKRRWVWTLGHDEEEEATLSGAMAALKAAQMAEAAAVVAAAAAVPAETTAVQSEADADLDLKTPLATRPNPSTALPGGEYMPSALTRIPQDIEMQDSTAEITATATATYTTAIPTTIPTATATKTAATRPEGARKRKSTPIPYATDSESDFGCDDDDADTGIDIDMQTPTTALGHHLQGAWLQAARETAGRTGAAAEAQADA